jgi:hypothetical protein
MYYFLSFVFGGLTLYFTLGVTEYNIQNTWKTAYEVGREDGYTLGRYEFEMKDSELEARCMFYNWEKSVEKTK